ncbi:hypothetical protein [Umezawaea sp. Da 62-37]|uniref:ATP-grasp domain-containing protein n=1 Tax=Umezawaea sp. Da 62-37 TaxID=3075927 RepID=UPI0028F6E4BF|nr:hypothetical protein [Umezawaea sp. Da 62-37]WNV85094.1 hypothetical protein RM788_44290 [Umezawaea sp. Da 62-37]
MTGPILLVVDYNLSRIDEVRHLCDHARERHGATVVLIRADPTAADDAVADVVIDLDPLREDFAESAERALDVWRDRIGAGIVFSDNAVRSGAELLRRLGVAVDSPLLAGGAFSKHVYRVAEARVADLLVAQGVMVPAFAEIASLDQLTDFAHAHPGGFVVKPAAEGNNRGVVAVLPGDDLVTVFAEVLPYVEGGVICEELIPYRREYSFDGLGPLSFLTEKVSASGRYPVEVAQVLPAVVDEHERVSLERAGRQANWLVGQRDGPFHNEIKLSDDGLHTAIVEPNRRPGGMRIWMLARWVYGIDLHHHWVDTAFGAAADAGPLVPGCSAATVLLGVSGDRSFSPTDIAVDSDPFAEAVAATAERFSLADGQLAIGEFSWLSSGRRDLHAVARDNADFAAQACVILFADSVDIRDLVPVLRHAWSVALDHALATSFADSVRRAR